jgi:hypothetical protein
LGEETLAMAPDRRRFSRTNTWVEAACHVRGTVRRARLTDVSNDGCRAEMAGKDTLPGDRVVIRLTDLLVLPATVVWVHERHAGLEFANPMIGAMLNQFVLRHGRKDQLH